MMSDTAGLPARRAAARAVVAVLDARVPLDRALERARGEAPLPPRDRAFAHALTAATLRHLGRVDCILERYVQRPPPALPHAILRVGAAQMLFLDTPPYAAVNAMAALAGEERDARRFKGLVNAVLRRVGEAGAAALEGSDPSDDWPAWLTASWRDGYGAQAAARIAAASAREAPLDLTVKSDPAGWAERLGGTLTPTGSIRLTDAGPVADLPGYAEGAWWVQDAAAALPVRLLGDVAGARVLDLCAAPGGKTLQLAAAGAQVTALDRAADRLDRLRANLERTGLAAELIKADALDHRPSEPFDAVLLDAPCTATGTLRRRPDVAWTKGPKDVASLSALQARLIAAAARSLKPGGALVYCTCSLQPQEGPGAIAAARAAGAPLRPVPWARDDDPGLARFVTKDGALRTFPHLWDDEGGMDGFFAAKLRCEDTRSAGVQASGASVSGEDGQTRPRP